MYGTDIVLRNDCGGEIAREPVGKYEDYEDALLRVVRDGLGCLNVGDTISFESVRHEEG